MDTERFEIILDIVRANQEGGHDRKTTANALYDVAGPNATSDTLILIDRAIRVVFDHACQVCIEHPGWRHDDVLRRVDSLDACRACYGSGVDQEVKPLPDISPVETLAEVIAIATSGLLALADEHEGNLRDAVTRLHEKSTTLLDLVTRW